MICYHCMHSSSGRCPEHSNTTYSSGDAGPMQLHSDNTDLLSQISRLSARLEVAESVMKVMAAYAALSNTKYACEKICNEFSRYITNQSKIRGGE